jgi:hypothetical protein
MLVSSSSKWLNITAIIQDNNFKLHSLVNVMEHMRKTGTVIYNLVFPAFWANVLYHSEILKLKKNRMRKYNKDCAFQHYIFCV